jgi:hypothetical protein
VKFLPAFGSALGAAVLAGGLVLHPELVRKVQGPPQPAVSPVAVTASDPAARQTVVSGMDPLTGVNSSSLLVDRSLLGLPVIPNTPSIQLPDVAFRPPGPGRGASVSTLPQRQQVGRNVVWQAQPEVDGPVRRVTRRSTTGYIEVPNEAGELHLLCGPGSASYYVDSRSGSWRIFRTDGGEAYDVSYQFVQNDRSPISVQSRCR